jgi:hypothetical protein
MVESGPSISMVCNILSFLDASPMTLFEGPPMDRTERDSFYEENLEALISCIIAADESVRRLATGVATRLFAKEQILSTLRASKGLGSKAFKTKFWRLTYVPSEGHTIQYIYFLGARRANVQPQVAHSDIYMRQGETALYRGGSQVHQWIP